MHWTVAGADSINGLVIRHGTSLARPDFAACICQDTSPTDGTPMAAIG